MSNWVAISRQRHQKASWQKPENYGFALQDHVAPVLVEEVPHLQSSKVLVFVPQPDSSFLLVTLQGLKPGENWFVRPNGRWLDGYIPAIYRGHPFRLLSAQADKPESKVLCADTSSECWSEDEKLAFSPVFNEEAELSEELAQVLTFLQKCEDNRVLTQQWVDQLSAAELIVPWNIKWQADKASQVQQVQGLYRIDEIKLKNLAAETLKELAGSGALSLAYAQLFSTHHMRVLRMLSQARPKANKVVPVDEKGEVDLDQLFGADEDIFKF